MPRGSKPGERRGGRQPGTPNKKTALVNAAFDAATSNPDLSPLDDLERLQALCTLFGMGLVLFKLNPIDPQFEKRVTARRFEPDMFYVNEFARRLQKTNVDAFNQLF